VGKIARAEADWPIAALEVAAGTALVVMFLRDLRDAVRHKKHPHPGIAWFDVAAGLMLVFEAFHGQHARTGYMRPQFLAGMATITVGLLHSKLKRRYLKLDETGVTCRPARFRGFAIAWAELESVDVSEENAVFHRKDGRRHTLALSPLNHREEVRRAIDEYVNLLPTGRASSRP
jgi:hypothetical protein